MKQTTKLRIAQVLITLGILVIIIAACFGILFVSTPSNPSSTWKAAGAITIPTLIVSTLMVSIGALLSLSKNTQSSLYFQIATISLALAIITYPATLLLAPAICNGVCSLGDNLALGFLILVIIGVLLLTSLITLIVGLLLKKQGD